MISTIATKRVVQHSLFHGAACSIVNACTPSALNEDAASAGPCAAESGPGACIQYWDVALVCARLASPFDFFDRVFGVLAANQAIALKLARAKADAEQLCVYRAKSFTAR